MRTHRVFLEGIIDERLNIQPMSLAHFDDLLDKGWRLLGFSMVRHSYGINREELCRTLPLRIRLDYPPLLSRSQRKLLRRNAHLEVRTSAINLTEEKQALFLKHTRRFSAAAPESILSFLHPDPTIPVPGIELCVYDQGRLFACSYMHLGHKAVSATYCFFDPDFGHYRPGYYTMLLEMDLARRLGKKYYYHGYCYDVPSQFDYKLNFYNLERMIWKTGEWVPQPRISKHVLGDLLF
ncbi:MAG: hypothetical protein RMJ33_02865 [Saprospiraceae bacterium]|nr:hypothetical protein [Saprospiraceae bacterium]MDW8228758.1 hypothetical protein [Saprospiraceae bacterium]